MPVTDATLRSRLRLVEIDSGWIVDELALTKGNRTKFVARPMHGQGPRPPGFHRVWFWKASLARYPLEFWSEILAHHIGSVVGVDALLSYPARYGDRYGALSPMMVDIRNLEFLVHGGDVLATVKPDFERKTGSDHSVQLILKALGDFAQLGFGPTVYLELYRQFVLDALIGNGDRHQDNWGFIWSRPVNGAATNEPKLASAFDNGSSLARELTQDTVEGMLGDTAAMDRYISKGRSHVRWDERGTLMRLSHEDLIRRHIATLSGCREATESVLLYSGLRLENAVRNVCRLSRTCSGVELSEGREELMVRLLIRRRERLVSILNEN